MNQVTPPHAFALIGGEYSVRLAKPSRLNAVGRLTGSTSMLLALAACGGGGGIGGSATNGKSAPDKTLTLSIQLDDLPNQVIDLNRTETLQLSKSGDPILIAVLSKSSKENSSLFNEDKLELRAFKFTPDIGLIEVSNQVLPDQPATVLTRNIILGDFDGNGETDVFLNNHGTEAFTPFPGEENMLLLNKNGTLRLADNFNLPKFRDFSHNGSAGDYDGDGFDDIFIINFGSAGENADYVLYGSSSGFSDPVYLRGNPTAGIVAVSGYGATESNMTASVAIDTNLDGIFEVLGTVKLEQSSDNMVFALLDLSDRSSPVFEPTTIKWRAGTEGAHQAYAADLNGDGYKDGIFLGFTADGETVFQMIFSSSSGPQDQSSRLGPTGGLFPVSKGVLDFKLVDFDQDGDIDILMKSWNESWVLDFTIALINDGFGNFSNIEFPFAANHEFVAFDILNSTVGEPIFIYGSNEFIHAQPI